MTPAFLSRPPRLRVNRSLNYEIVERAGALWVHTTANAVEPGLDHDFDLVPAGNDDFHPRQYRGGKVVGDEPDELLIFEFDGNSVTGFEIRGIAEDKVLARATRVRR